MTDNSREIAIQRVREAERGRLPEIGKVLESLINRAVTPPGQIITAADAIDLEAEYVSITGPAASTYAVTLAAPTRTGIVKVIEMIATTGTNAVTLALTNVIGGSAATTATFNAAAETLVLISAGTKWVVLAEAGVTLA